MKSRIITDTLAWLVCFVTLAFYIPLTDWGSAQAFPRHLNKETVVVATLGGITWVTLRALSRRRAIKSDPRGLSLRLALLSPIAAWAIAWGVAWLAFSPSVGLLVRSPALSSVPRVFTLVPLIVAGYGWGLASELMVHVRYCRRMHAQTT